MNFSNHIRKLDLLWSSHNGIKLKALFLRIISLGVKFLFFTIFVPKKITVSDFGYLSLILTTITLFVFIIGFDFYRFTHRELINLERNVISERIFNHLILTLVFSVISFPIFWFVLKPFGITLILLSWGVLITEYLSQEFYRYLILFARPILGNLSLLFRSSVWIFLIVILQYFGICEISIPNILFFWICGNMVLLFTISIYFLIKFRNRVKIKININWIKKGLALSSIFILGSFSLKTIEYSDRYIIEYFLNSKELGVYSFCSNFSNIINVFVSTSILSIYYPKVLKTFKKGDMLSFKGLIQRVFKEVFIIAIIVSLMVLFCYPYIVSLIGKEIYLSGFKTLILLLIGIVVFNISLVIQLVLYCLKKDKTVMFALIISALLNVCLNFILIPKLGIIGAAISTMVAFMSLLIYNSISLKKDKIFV